MSFDPEAYTITIRKETIDDEIYFVGRVAEFPNISVFEETFNESHSLVLDAIISLHSIAMEQGVTFPSPNPSIAEECSGRITLRLPKSLHAKIARYADSEDVSLNTYLVTAISTFVGETNGLARATQEIGKHLHALWFRMSTDSRAIVEISKLRHVVSPDRLPKQSEKLTNVMSTFRTIKHSKGEIAYG